MKKIFLFFILSSFAFSVTCRKAKILGVFPKIVGVSCDTYALMIGLASALTAFIFWSQITK